MRVTVENVSGHNIYLPVSGGPYFLLENGGRVEVALYKLNGRDIEGFLEAIDNDDLRVTDYSVEREDLVEKNTTLKKRFDELIKRLDRSLRFLGKGPFTYACFDRWDFVE